MLFNKANLGAAEMKSILGFIYASHSFDNLRTDLILVQDQVTELIGNDLYDELVAHYNSDDYEAVVAEGEEADPDKVLMTELVHRVQQAMAFYAYFGYSRHADVSHSDEGRKIVVTETIKPAFEWMLERDDQALISKAHRLMERILEYLELHKDQATINAKWTTLPIFESIRELFINNAREFDAVFPIDRSRRLFLKLVPFIREVEFTKIRAVLGPAKWSELKSELLADQFSEDNAPVFTMVRVPLALFTMAIALKRLGAEVLPEGIFQNLQPGIQTMKAKLPSPMEVKAEMARSLENEGNKALMTLQEKLAKDRAYVNNETYTPQNLVNRNKDDNKYFRM